MLHVVLIVPRFLVTMANAFRCHGNVMENSIAAIDQMRLSAEPNLQLKIKCQLNVARMTTCVMVFGVYIVRGYVTERGIVEMDPTKEIVV